jgi:glucosyl-dolichyl phosphate glucuronosyltransferase
MLVSIIIPTYNRPRDLLQAMCSLQEQVLADFEIIVVDNAADSAVKQMVTEFNGTARVAVRYVPEARLGLHYARHAGARAANGEILIFTDDDATFDPIWLQAYATAFAKHPEMAAAGGPVRPIWEVPPPQWLVDFIGTSRSFGILSLMEPYEEFRLDQKGKGMFIGVNMAIRSYVFFEVGGFNPEAFGDIWLGDGESGLNRKLCERGMFVGYVPEAVVYHHIPATRMTVDYFRRRMGNQGACDMYARFHRKVVGPFPVLKCIASLVVKNAKSWIAAPLLNGRTDPRSLRIQLDSARTQSSLKYVLRLIIDKDLRKLVYRENWLDKPSASDCAVHFPSSEGRQQ